jgi:choline-sulfatase
MVFRKKASFVVLATAAATIAFAATRKVEPKKSESPPNVLLITIDTLRPDRLSCYGGRNRTPNLDQIASKGLLFENAFSQVPLTLPSHTSILTGLFPVHHGVHNNGLESFNKKEFLVSELFHQKGYKTGAVVSSFVLDRKFGLNGGFDVYDDKMERLPNINSNFEVERPANQVYDAAVRILGDFSGNWFLWLHFYDPHTPYSPPTPLKGYEGEIFFVDQQIGKLQQWLKARNLDRNLVLAVVADHGESLGEHGEETHGFFIYNSTVKVPLLLCYPGVPAGKRIKNTAASVDLTPTLLELAGIKDSQKRDGQSLLTMLRGENRTHDIYLESRYPELLGWNGLQGMIQSNWKLIFTTRSELYDWQTDPNETVNLYIRKESIARSLKKELGQFTETATASSGQPDAETLEKLKSLGYISTTNIAKSARTADPKDKIAIWAIYEKSLQFKNAGKEKESLHLLESLVEKDPANNFFCTTLASRYRQAKDYKAAVQQLQLAIKNDPSDKDAYQELALTLKDQRNYKEAIKAVQAALALDPERSDSRSILGLLLVETARFEEAKQQFTIVLKKDPNNPAAWNNLGNALRELNDLDQAEEAYKKAIELSPHYAYPLNGLATVLVRKNQTQKAIPFMEKALDLDPTFVEVYLNLGIAYHTLGQKEKAKTLYKAFLKIAPDWMEKEREDAKLLLSQLP